ncbi:LLM class flavin-dependent oxidoreductase [Paucibacter sp. R3-3]|uniref:LLM class flavin-dependent oxidoreductase n=1 Tax=Roseateles agri TaxID=3098619 RepID=A0ABU5DKE1_9BURK|nr:LLM class flavin-dependent oxidoreductase [Paucibacter sp. R3-3]MDY0746747.1 LLM class flavin-dependent oxidoreductase [Paucibacter sp. R3-3]
MSIQHLALLIPGNYVDSDPATGLEATLKLFTRAETLGFDSAWVRQRHLERGVSSASTFLAAATQRTRHIGLGAAVIQMGYENPFRLAEDLATVDVLSGGRLQVGVSTGPPPHGALLGDRLLDAHPSTIDFSHRRVSRLRDSLRGDFLGDDAWIESPAGRQRARLHPAAPGLTDRLWYGGGSLYSAEWAGRNGFNLLIGNICRAEQSDDFFTAQTQQLDLFRSSWQAERAPRIALGRVILPTDGADAATRKRYREFAAGRHARTLAPQGERRTLFAPDLVGSADEILDTLSRDPVLPQVSELRLELPYDFRSEEYAQIIEDAARLIAPALGRPVLKAA